MSLSWLLVLGCEGMVQYVFHLVVVLAEIWHSSLLVGVRVCHRCLAVGPAWLGNDITIILIFFKLLSALDQKVGQGIFVWLRCLAELSYRPVGSI